MAPDSLRCESLGLVVESPSAARESCDRAITGTFISFARPFRPREMSVISWRRLESRPRRSPDIS